MRQVDVDELNASIAPGSIEEIVRESVAMSTYCRVFTINDRLACIFGVVPANILTGIGHPWMLGTDLIERYSHLFIRRQRLYVAKIAGMYPKLLNCVDHRNKVSIHWLKKMGFDVSEEPVSLGKDGHPFHVFRMGFDDV